MNKVLVLSFKKNNGKNFKFNVDFPVDNVEARSINSLADVLISRNILEFKDNSQLARLEKAYYQEIKTQEVSIA